MARHNRLIGLTILAATLVGCGGTTTPGLDNAYNGTSAYGGSAPYPVASGDPYNSSTYPTVGTPPISSSPTPVPVSSSDPSGDSASPTPSPTDSPLPYPTDGASPAPTDSPSPMPSFPAVSGTGLRIIDVQPTKVLGLCDYIIPCFKAKINSVSIQNPLMNATQTGQLIISFLSNGVVVSDPISQAVSLPPAAIEVFGPFEATVRSDTANAQVTTDGQ